jgi:hypothetical protein
VVGNRRGESGVGGGDRVGSSRGEEHSSWGGGVREDRHLTLN